MKKLIIVLISMFCMSLTVCAYGDDDINLIVEQELSLFDFSGWNYSDNDISIDASEMIDEYVSGKSSTNAHSIFDYVVNAIKNMLVGKLPYVLLLLVCAIASGLSSSLLPDEKSRLREMVSFITCIMCIGVVVGIVCDMLSSAISTISAISKFSDTAMPVLSLIMIASGRGATESVFSPMMALLSGGVIGVVNKIIMPLIIMGYVLAFFGGISSKTQITKFFVLIKSAIKWSCGIMTTVFLGIVAISGIGARSHDTLTMKTTKYVVDKAVPFAGNLLSGAADTIYECFNAIKMAAGSVFIVIIVLIAAKALLGILCTNIALRIAAAISEPVADVKIPKLLSDVADISKCLFAAVIAVEAMFVISAALCTVVLV